MVCRKHSYTYIEFIRGKYNILDHDYLQILIDRMTIHEKAMVKRYPFNKLWNDLWGNNNRFVKEHSVRNDFYRSAIKFNILLGGFRSIKDGKWKSLYGYINNSHTQYIEPEWYFPKGKPDGKHESNIDCAIREFIEETNLNASQLMVMMTNDAMEEEHMGCNGRRYKTIFYMALYPSMNDLPDTKNKYQEDEVSNIMWLSPSQCIMKIRSYEKEKHRFIKDYLFP